MAAKLIGVCLIIMGALLNEWLLRAIFSADGTLERQTRLIIWSFDLFLLGLGIVILWQRNNERFQLNLLVLFGSLLFCLFCAEIFFRIELWARIKYQAFVMSRVAGPFRENPYGTGSYRLKPNLNMKLERNELVFTNNHGMRSKETSYENVNKKQRIAFVGDSFTFGMAASSSENTFVGVFDSKIDHLRYEVLNFGVPGYGFGDMELLINEEIIKFHPAYLFLMSYNANDFADTYFGVNRFKLTNGYLGKGLLQECIERLPPKNRTNKLPQTFLESIELHNRITRLMSRIRETYYWKEPPKINFWVDDNFAASNVFWSRKQYPPVALEAKDVSLETLKRIHDLCLRNKIRLIIVTIPFVEQIYAVSEEGSDYDIRYPQKYIEDFAKKNGIPYLDLLPALRSNETVRRENIFSPESHFSDTGYRIIGDILADYFKGAIVNSGGN